MTRPRLEVSVIDHLGRPARAPGLASFLERVRLARARGVMSVALVNDATMRRLNRQFRGIDETTDVLSFPAERPLGDVAISLPAARRQARDLGHSLAIELRILALHGLLHLLGYDHETDRGQMRRVEERLRKRAGLPSGLIARPGASRR